MITAGIAFVVALGLWSIDAYKPALIALALSLVCFGLKGLP